MGYFVVLAQNCLPSMLDYIVMQMRKTNREKGYLCLHVSNTFNNRAVPRGLSYGTALVTLEQAQSNLLNS